MGHTTGEKSTAQTLDDHQMQDAATRGQPNAYLAEMGRRGQADELRGATPRPGQAGDLRDMGRRGQSEELRRSSQESVARQGVAGSGGRLPHADRIQRAFGRHDVGGIQAHTDDRAAAASDALGARGYAIEGQVAFAGAPDLHTAAHEAAHVIQGGGGVHMKGSGPRDAHEDHADAVADAVVRGESAEGLLDAGPGASGATAKGVRLQEADADTAQQQAPLVAEEEQEQAPTTPSGDPTPAQLAARQSALANLTEFERQVERNFRSWRIAARNVGSAYELAGDRHTQAIQRADREQALTEAIMFGILTAASAGALSWLSTVVQNQRASASVLFNALEDATQAGVGEGIDIIQGAVAPSGTPVSAGPLGYQNSLLNHLDELMNNVSTHFSTVQRGLMSESWGFWDSFDPSAQANAHATWMASSPLASPPEVPTAAEMADSLETDMWAAWAPGLHSVSIETVGCAGIRTREVDRYRDPGGPVETRLDALGITEAAGIGDFGIWTTDGEVRKLVAWAGTHQPRRLLDL